MNAVDQYLKNPHLWPKEIVKLRSILLKTNLEENLKWGLPCYSYNGANVVMIQPFKFYLCIMFFKGVLLKDPQGLLINNGPHSQATRRLMLGSVQEIAKRSSLIKSYVRQAIAIEESGQKIKYKKKPEPLPLELKKVFSKSPKLKKAFEALTPGRQRAYILHFSGAKQSATRQSRIEKCIPAILKGKGLNER